MIVSASFGPNCGVCKGARVMGLEDRIDNRPRCLNRISRVKSAPSPAMASPRKPLVGRFVARPLFRHVELLLLSDEIFARELYAGSESTSRVRRDADFSSWPRTENAEPTAPFQQSRLRRGS